MQNWKRSWMQRLAVLPGAGNKAQGMEKTGIDAAYEAGRNAGIFLFRFANDTIQHHLYLGRKGRHYDFKGNTKF